MLLGRRKQRVRRLFLAARHLRLNGAGSLARLGAPAHMEVAMERKQTMNGTWAALLGGVALGALSMYMLDPAEGRRRWR